MSSLPFPLFSLVTARTLIDACGEEFLFRVMLLTYFVAYFKSRSLALLASSTLFGFAHVPGGVDFSGPLYATICESALIWVTTSAVGLALGVAWLKTRSLVLVAVAHAMLNFGPELSQAAEVWT
jgi:membrane protease YdiL (CAAX protease family)